MCANPATAHRPKILAGSPRTTPMNLRRLLSVAAFLALSAAPAFAQVAAPAQPAAPAVVAPAKTATTPAATTPIVKKINLNTATAAEIDTLPQIGPARASGLWPPIGINRTVDDCASCNGHAVVPHSREPDSQEGYSHAGTRSRGVQFRARGNGGYAARERPQLRGCAHRAARRRDRSQQHFPARSVARAWQARRAWHHGARGGRRAWARLSRALRCDGGDFAGLGRTGPRLRRPLQSMHQPAPSARQRRAEAALSAEAHFRRACRRARDLRAQRRIRRCLDAHPGREEG